MNINPHINSKNWDEYVESTFDVPAPMGYILATIHYTQNLKELLTSELSPAELKTALLEFIIERSKFVTHAENHMPEFKYDSIPEYVA